MPRYRLTYTLRAAADDGSLQTYETEITAADADAARQAAVDRVTWGQPGSRYRAVAVAELPDDEPTA